LLPLSSDLLSSHLFSKNTEIKINGTIRFPVVLYGCETWSLTLRHEHRLRVFENRVLRRIFGPKADGIIRGCRDLHNYELHIIVFQHPVSISSFISSIYGNIYILMK
jgi:hypothetical protein